LFKERSQRVVLVRLPAESSAAGSSNFISLFALRFKELLLELQLFLLLTLVKDIVRYFRMVPHHSIVQLVCLIKRFMFLQLQRFMDKKLVFEAVAVQSKPAVLRKDEALDQDVVGLDVQLDVFKQTAL
jgi:hypothetical protein